ncbi:MAG TPA: ABC transporter substrate-binding protein [Microbacteriaceae bacterium]|nr:ABC transporter substrate-binding protein [Microbacteriaceae bacterium]
MRFRRKTSLAAVAAAGALVALVLAGCSTSNPTASPSSSAAAAKSSQEPIVVGSAAFPENEILAEIYAQALTGAGIPATTHLDIGQRPAYLKAMKEGSIDLVPEYSGNLLQFYNKDTTDKSSAGVFAALQKAIPSSLEVLPEAEAQDRDSYNVTKEFAKKYGLVSLGDLTKAPQPLIVGGNPELGQRPYGLPGLKSVYGVTSTLKPISDSGGPLTIKALQDGTIQVADIFTTTPAITQFVTLKDPKNMVLAQNIVPLIRKSKASAKVKSTLDAVSAKLTTKALIAMNGKSSGSAKESSAQIAKEWLSQEGLD